MKKFYYFSSIIIIVFLLLLTISFIFFGFYRINNGINFLQDNFTKHYANVGLLYLKLGMISGTILIVLLTLLVVSIFLRNKR